MSNDFLEAKHGLLKPQLHIVVQIVTDPFENVMRLLLNLEYNVALEHIRNLFSLALELNCVAVLHAWLDIDLKSLWFGHETTTPALGTHLRKHLAFALTLVTRLLHLHLHHAHINVLHNDALPLALITNLHIASLSPSPLTLITVNLARHMQLSVRTFIKFLQCGFDSQFIIRAFLSAISTLFIAVNFIFTLLVVNLALGVIW